MKERFFWYVDVLFIRVTLQSLKQLAFRFVAELWKMTNYGNDQNYWDSAQGHQNQSQDFNFEMPDQFTSSELWALACRCLKFNLSRTFTGTFKRLSHLHILRLHQHKAFTQMLLPQDLVDRSLTLRKVNKENLDKRARTRQMNLMTSLRY